MDGGRSGLAADFDLAAAAAFGAVAAAAAGTAGAFAAVAAGEACSRGASASVARGAVSVAWGIAIDANVGRHWAPPGKCGDSARVSSRCQIEEMDAVQSGTATLYPEGCEGLAVCLCSPVQQEPSQPRSQNAHSEPFVELRVKSRCAT